MIKNLSRYIWTHTRRQQVIILLVVALSMVPYFISLDLPRQIINGPIQGEGFETADSTQPFSRISFHLPFIGPVVVSAGYQLDRMSTLIALSVQFLALVVINNAFKYMISIYKGRLGERLLRRIRFQLIDRVLRFPPSYFKRTKSSEVATMIKDEVEPIGGFAGDAFVAPAMLGGQILAALGFILAQNLWLGTIAVAMATLQLAIIPRMRRRLIRLGRQRQLTARQLAGRVGEMVDGISTIHAYDTSNFERADMSRRLGQIFAIRYDLYQWKFMVKFINNFLAQVTPFLFYCIGGYFTLKGSVDVGQLVAVINAYKDLPGPLKELIDWDQARQDVQVKWEQVVEQFESDVILPEELQEITHAVPPALPGPIAAVNLILQDDSGRRLVNDVSVKIGRGEVVALLDINGTAAVAFAEAMGRTLWPASGRIAVGDVNILDLPESVTGRRLSYVSAESYFFQGNLKDNLLYGLKHAPLRASERNGKAAVQRRREITEARATGNVDFDVEGEWIGAWSVSEGIADHETLNSWILDALDTVLLTDDVFDLGLRSVIEPSQNERLVTFAIEARRILRRKLVELSLPQLVVPFDFEAYNTEATIADNLLFGTITGGDATARRIASSDYFRSVLSAHGLDQELVDAGRRIIAMIVEIFGEDQHNTSSLPELPFMEEHDLSDLSRLLKEVDGKRSPALSEQQREVLLLASFAYVESRFRFGILTDEIRHRIVRARQAFYDNLPPALETLIVRFNPDKYQADASLLENIVFGKISRTHADASDRIMSQIKIVAKEKGRHGDLLEAGLNFNLGPGGKRLSLLQRQKLNVGRAVIRKADYCILNQPLPGLNPALQTTLVQNVISFLRRNSEECTIIWVLSNPLLCRYFERVIVFDNGEIIADDSYEMLAAETSAVRELIAG